MQACACLPAGRPAGRPTCLPACMHACVRTRILRRKVALSNEGDRPITFTLHLGIAAKAAYNGTTRTHTQ